MYFFKISGSSSDYQFNNNVFKTKNEKIKLLTLYDFEI